MRWFGLRQVKSEHCRYSMIGAGKATVPCRPRNELSAVLVVKVVEVEVVEVTTVSRNRLATRARGALRTQPISSARCPITTAS